MPTKSLVIVESPAKAKTINKFLGSNYQVKSCWGHVRDLPKSKLGVNVEDDFQPEYVTVRGRGKVVKEIQKAAKEVDRILLASDPDREGEAISWHLSEILGNKDSIYRINFHEITKTAIREAVKNPGRIDLNKVNAQQARRILDRIVGYKLSPLLWKKVGRGLSAGRVQSVAVRLVYEREKEIEKFVPQEYWSVIASLRTELSGDTFEAKLEKIDSEKAKIDNEEQVKKIVDELKGAEFHIKSIKRKDQRRNPSPPFTTSYLQQEASRKLRFTVRKTMRVAQQLYEGLEVDGEGSVGLITYMRTDSVRVSAEAQQEAASYIKDKFGPEFLPSQPPQYRAKKGAQDAHEAIRPTDVGREPERLKPFLSLEQYQLYKLIWNRFLASQMKPALFKMTTVDIAAGRFILRATGLEMKFKGFMAVYVEAKEEEEKQPGNGSEDVAGPENSSSGLDVKKKNEKLLPELKEGEKLTLLELLPGQHFTKPPSRFSEAGLVRALEEEGIGRPSTYAPIINTIQERQYVEKIQGRFHPTELGGIVTELLVNHFPEILDVKFTANLENKLDGIEEGEVDWVQLLREFYQPFIITLDKANREAKRVKRKEIPTDQTCPDCGGVMMLKTGRYGKFLACGNFPECRHTQSVTLGVKCPQEGCEGEIVERRSKKGRTFFGCNRFPECKFLSWDKPVDKKCPQCGAGFLVEKRGKEGQTYHKCVDKECGYKETIEKD
ncbi:MAG: type I DNA topoisomerase [Nitrospirae bacterium]|nr:type I DNA topoisomerase [Nitrospirota bacterium]